MDLVHIAVEFPTEAACLRYLEKLRWPDGVRCLKCGAAAVSRIVTREGVRSRKRVNKAGNAVEQRIPARHLYQCLKCRHQFTVKTGTVLNDSHLPLQKWFRAVVLIANATAGISARQMQQELQVGYQTAWHLCHRIRTIMRGDLPLAPTSATEYASEA